MVENSFRQRAPEGNQVAERTPSSSKKPTKRNTQYRRGGLLTTASVAAGALGLALITGCGGSSTGQGSEYPAQTETGLSKVIVPVADEIAQTVVQAITKNQKSPITRNAFIVQTAPTDWGKGTKHIIGSLIDQGKGFVRTDIIMGTTKGKLDPTKVRYIDLMIEDGGKNGTLDGEYVLSTPIGSAYAKVNDVLAGAQNGGNLNGYAASMQLRTGLRFDTTTPDMLLPGHYPDRSARVVNTAKYVAIDLAQSFAPFEKAYKNKAKVAYRRRAHSTR